MKTKLTLASLMIGAAFLTGCASQQGPVKTVQNAATVSQQEQAQEAAMAKQVEMAPVLKRKVALGRISNETNYGRSLVRALSGDKVGKQVSDMFAKSLTQSGAFTVLERSDLDALRDEARLSGNKLEAVGADVLIIGSLTEFGRKTVGQSGFFSSSKKQIAFAKVDVRVVDTHTGRVLFSTSGAGESTNERSDILGMGAKADYDGTLNDKAINAAVSECVNNLVTKLKDRPWKTYFLMAKPGQVIISGGALQGLNPGMELAVKTAGEQIKSPQTGFMIQVPGKEIARIKVVSTFGEDAETEGSVVEVVRGSIAGRKIADLVVEEVK